VANSREGALTIRSVDGNRSVRLRNYLSPAAADRAKSAANRWIKALRHIRIDGRAFRDRFTFRGDSLWWFAEIYLHKTQRLESVIETIEAAAELARVERPAGISLTSPASLDQKFAADALRRHGVNVRGPRSARDDRAMAHLRLLSKAHAHAAGAMLIRLRRVRPPAVDAPCDVAVFVHSAFWRGDAIDDTYLGPVLAALLDRVLPERVRFVGLGPRTNFRARTWRHRARDLADDRAPGIVTPVEAFAPRDALAASAAFWRERGAVRRALVESPAIREAAIIDGVDTWPVVTHLLTGISHLQFPWSARAMDEAAAALDCLRPRVVFTYAEAGGWGRALMLEARRRSIPTVALQHGLIYRHWLNYQHEPDELAVSSGNASDRGFPLPTLTLLHDGFAANQLMDAGRFPADALAVTGSVRLDAIVRSAGRLSTADHQAVRASVGARSGDHLVVVAAKFTQIAHVFADVLHACRRLSGVRLVVKCHPGESPAPYERAIEGAPFATVVSSGADLGSLLAVARLLVTVNSTSAIEAMVLGVPALIVDLPNNLSPFVDAGVMAGSETAAELPGLLEALLYDESSRGALADRRRRFLDLHGITADGRAAERAVDAIIAVMNGHTVTCGR
jgi:hypothetical protein